MKKNPLLKRIGTLLFCSSISSFSFSQTVEKTSLISYSDFPFLKTPTSYLKFGLGSDKNLKLYGTQFIPGKFKSETTKKYKGPTFFSGGDMKDGTTAFFERNISTNLDSLGSQRFVLIDDDGDAPAQKFEVATIADFLVKGLPKELDVKNSYTIFKEYPVLEPNTDSEPVQLKVIGAELRGEGKGIFGNKEPKSFPVLIYSRGLDKKIKAENEALKTPLKLNSVAVTGDKLNEDAPFKEENMQLLDGYMNMNESKATLMTKDAKIFNGILGLKIEDEKWSYYKKMAFVTFNDNGKIIQKDTINFPYIRRVFYSYVVRDFSGIEKGFVYFFGGMSTIGGKKEKDPEENNFQIVYIGLDGKIKYKRTFQRGIPTNKMGLSPIMVIEKDGKLLAWNMRSDKALTEYVPEILVFDEKGNMTVKNENLTLDDVSKKNGISFQTLVQFSQIQKSMKTIFDNGKTTIVGQLREGKTRSVPNSVGSTSLEEYFEYGKLMSLSFEDNGKLPEGRTVSLPVSLKPLDNYILNEGDKNFNSFITIENSNFYVSYDNYEFKSKWINAVQANEPALLFPQTTMMKNNFAVDKENRKAYFVYRTPIKDKIKLMKVGY
jgi:hypothetical protein